MWQGDVRCPFEICDRAGHAPHPLIPPCRQAKPVCRPGQQGARFGVKFCNFIQLRPVRIRIAVEMRMPFKSAVLRMSGLCNPRSHFRGSFCRWGQI